MSKSKKIIIGLIVIALIFNFSALSLFLVKKAQAQGEAATTAAVIGQTAKTVLHWLKEAWGYTRDKIILRAGKIAYKNALRNFLSRVAYDTATEIATGGTAKTPLFDTKFIDDFVRDVAETTLVDTLDVLTSSCKSGLPDNKNTWPDESEPGTCKATINFKPDDPTTDWVDESTTLTELDAQGKVVPCVPTCLASYVSFNVCEPANLDFSVALNATLFNEFSGQGGHRPKCTFNQLKEKWADWNISLSSDIDRYSQMTALDILRSAFSPQETDIGLYLTMQGEMRNAIKNKEWLETIDRIGRDAFKPVTEPITKAIKTPASLVKDQTTQSLVANEPVYEQTPTNDIVADAVGIFTNTLASKLMKRLLQKGLTEGERVQTTQIYNWVSAQASTLTLQTQFADLEPVTLQPPGGPQRILEDLTSCPNPEKPGPLECVIPSQLIYAIEQKMTVKQALDHGYLDGTKPVGWLAPSGQIGSFTQPNYLSGYPYRSLVILRTQRIIPVGWELAAWYARLENQTRDLNYFINCFEDQEHADDPTFPISCRGDELDYNPYYHLVDPNWVLKSPEVVCQRKGAGYEIVSEDWVCSENNVEGTIVPGVTESDPYPYCEDDAQNPDLPVRQVLRNDDYCADWQSCLKENDDGSCQNSGYGYCLKEKETWRLKGESCPSYYATCENLIRTSDNQQFSFLTSTLTPCSENEAGCLWYALTQERSEPPSSTLEWLTNVSNPRIYLNDSALTCDTDSIGCTKVAKMLPVEEGGNLVFNGGFESASTTNPLIPTDWVFEQNGTSNITGWEKSLASNESYDNSTALKMIVDTIEITGNGVGIVTEGYIPVDTRFTYQFSMSFKGSGDNQYVQVLVKNYKEDFSPAGTDWWTNLTVNPVQALADEQWKTIAYDISGEGSLNNQFRSDTRYIKLFIIGPMKVGGVTFSVNSTVWFDNVNLAIKESPVVADNLENYSYATTSENAVYSEDNNLIEHLKLAPAYLHCEDYNTILFGYSDSDEDIAECFADGHYFRDDIEHCVLNGDELCQEYATYCEAEEIGCQGYTPKNGDPEVPAKTVLEDTCPNECADYDNYIELFNYFEEVECPMYENQADCLAKGCSWNASATIHCSASEQQQLFIPQTAQSCSSNEAGCEEFTNLDELAKGGEGLEYFRELRQCISPDNPNIGYYYTWEGSDTTGYQLKKWEFLKSNINNVWNPAAEENEIGVSPCTNITIGTEACTDTANNIYFCAPEVIAGGNYNCRDFFDSLGHHFYRLQNYAVTASSECHPYRRTLTGQIYNADPSEATSCSASAKGCKEYKGNSGNNVENIISEDFEGSTNSWVWMDSESYVMNGMEQSSEAVVQSEHSLLVHLTDDTLAYPVYGLVEPNKRYTLSFWAKKTMLSSSKTTPGSGGLNYWMQQGQQGGQTGFNPLRRLMKFLGARALAQGSSIEPVLTFSTTITNEWNDYVLGPIEITFEEISQQATLNLHIDGLSSTEGFYIDNIILKEYTDNFYVIKNSWETPISCDNDLDNAEGLATCSGTGGSPCILVDQTGASFTCNIPTGETSCQVAGGRWNLGSQQGCLEYQDRNNNTHYLKSFDYICSDTAIGCQAFINTQNSSEYQGEHIYGNFVCNSQVGTIESNGDCVIQGQVVCNVGEEDSCTYDSGDLPNNGAKVPNDEIVYAVYDEEKTCIEDKQGCMRLGQPELNKQKDFNDPDYVQDVQTVNLINNPDDYEDSLCGPSAEFCQSYTISGNVAKFYYYDPIGAPTTSGATSLTCYYDTTNNQWLKSGGAANEECPGGYSINSIGYLPGFADYDYQDWVGLCSASAAGCTEYRDPEDPLYEQIEECDSAINPNLTGICNDDTGIVSGDYCSMEINGMEHKVCDIDGSDATCGQEGTNNWRYTATDWICPLNSIAGINGADCCLGGSTPNCDDNEANEVKVCHVDSGYSRCYYAPVCQSYYYKASSVDTSGCNGIVDREKGCHLFNNTSNTNLSFSSDISLDGGAPGACFSEQVFTGPEDCDANILLEAQKDRECQEWLQCGSSFQISESESACLDLVRCGAANPDNPAACTKIIIEPTPDLTIDLTNSSERAANFDRIRYLSGFSHVGAKWSDSKEVQGYYVPEQMEQSGLTLNVANGGFESASADNPLFWSFCYYDNNCAGSPNAWWGSSGCDISLDMANVYSGQHSLKINKTNPSNECPYLNANIVYDPTVNETTGEDNFYQITPSQDYNLSFYAKSENNNQTVSVGVKFYTAANPSTGIDSWSTLAVEPETTWGKYTIIFHQGDTTDPNPNDNIYYRTIPSTPSTANYFRITIGRPNIPSENIGIIWLDNFTIEPLLNLSDGLQISKDCRLFPKNDAPACEYQQNHHYVGWNGYCLEPDPFSAYNPDPLNPQNTQQCLQWYPIDSLAGDPLSVFNQQLSYNGPAPLYYCAQSEGNCNLGKTDSDVGYYTNNYIIQSHVQKILHTDASCGGQCPEQDGNANFSFCLEEHDSFGDNDKQFCWTSDGVAIPGTPQAGGESLCSDDLYTFSEPDSSIHYNNLVDGVYVEGDDNAGGWGGTAGELQLMDYNLVEFNGIEYHQYHRSLMSGNGEGCQFWVWFRTDDKSLKEIAIFCDDTQNCVNAPCCGGAHYNLYFPLKEPCTTIIQVVGIPESLGSPNKVWWNRYNNGWTDYSTNVLKYNQYLIQPPYGSLNAEGGFDPNKLYTVIHGNNNLSDDGYAGLPYSTANIMGDIPDSLGNSGRTCIAGEEDNFGDACNDDENCGAGGVCSGIGKYCFNNLTGLMVGSSSSGPKECGVDSGDCGTGETCKAIGHTTSNVTSTVNLSNVANIAEAIGRIQNLFAKVYGIWTWDYANGSYIATSASSLNVNEDIANSGSAPIISNIKINNQTSGNVELPLPGGNINLDFNTDVNSEQLPLVTIYVNWRDGGAVVPLTYNGYDKPDISAPHRLSHSYYCQTNAAGTACTTCGNGGSLNNGQCEWERPGLNIKDHWGWCASGGYKDEDACTVVPVSTGNYYGSSSDKIIINP